LDCGHHRTLSRTSGQIRSSAKRQLYADQLHHNVGSAIEHSKQLIGVMMTQPDFKEGVAAFADAAVN
jgi:enoyl-CoA hydratase/carnithine racemase